MPLSVLGLQAAIADGSEPTFDGQPMQAGTHLRWAFTPEFGFPPGAFWLFRRSLCDPPCGRIAPPAAVSKAIADRRLDGRDTAATKNPRSLGSAVSFTTAGDAATSNRCDRCCCCIAAAGLAKASSDPAAIAAEELILGECGHTLIERCTSDEPGSEPADSCNCCRCAARRQPPVNISITICCCCSGDRRGGTGGKWRAREHRRARDGHRRRDRLGTFVLSTGSARRMWLAALGRAVHAASYARELARAVRRRA